MVWQTRTSDTTGNFWKGENKMKKQLLVVVVVAMIVLPAGGSVGATAGQLSQAQGAQKSQPPQGASSMEFESAPLAPVGSGFTYQGRLVVSGSPASGNYDFSFALFDAATGGNQIGNLLID